MTFKLKVKMVGRVRISPLIRNSGRRGVHTGTWLMDGRAYCRLYPDREPAHRMSAGVYQRFDDLYIHFVYFIDFQFR
jgi:hypothetical protein